MTKEQCMAPEKPVADSDLAPSILVVEDDAGLNRLIQKSLAMTGYRTAGAFSGAEALDAVVKMGNVLLLLDYKLPDMTGEELIRRLGDGGPVVPFIVMTGYGDENTAVAMMKLGALEYIVKESSFIKRLPHLVAQAAEGFISRRLLARAEQDAKSSQAFLDSIINAIADPIFVKDESRCFVLVNDALCAIVGRSRDELLAKDGDDMFPPEQVAVFRKMDAAVLDTGEENINEERLSNLASGELRTIVTRKTRYIDHAGKRFLVGVIRDITQRKRGEELLKKQLLELQRWQDVMLNREDRVRELKSEVNGLCGRLGEPVHYPSQDSLEGLNP